MVVGASGSWLHCICNQEAEGMNPAAPPAFSFYSVWDSSPWNSYHGFSHLSRNILIERARVCLVGDSGYFQVDNFKHHNELRPRVPDSNACRS